jgi:GTP cyclohydrolase I
MESLTSVPGVAASPFLARDVWTWERVYAALATAPPGKLWGIPRGGQIVAGLTGRAVDAPEDADVLIDDIVDSGATRDRWCAAYPGRPFWALTQRRGTWIQFPWEQQDGAKDIEDTVRRQLEWLGEDWTREGLQKTPGRVIRALQELTAGYHQSPAELLRVTFQAECDQMVVVRQIPYWSLCEHHMLPFHGQVSLGYIPKEGRLAGLSKFPRLVECFARRLQMQERLTQQIADALMVHLQPLGVGVYVTGQHTCMQMRGVRSAGQMNTSALRGVLLDKPEARAEFFALLHSIP